MSPKPDPLSAGHMHPCPHTRAVSLPCPALPGRLSLSTRGQSPGLSVRGGGGTLRAALVCAPGEPPQTASGTWGPAPRLTPTWRHLTSAPFLSAWDTSVSSPPQGTGAPSRAASSVWSRPALFDYSYSHAAKRVFPARPGQREGPGPSDSPILKNTLEEMQLLPALSSP